MPGASKKTAPRKYALERLDSLEKGLLAAQAGVAHLLSDVKEVKDMLKESAPPPEQESMPIAED